MVKNLSRLHTFPVGRLPAGTVLSGEEIELSYRELSERSRRIATVLSERGVAPGDRVAIMAGNDAAIEAHTTYHAVHHLGAVSVPVNAFCVDRELEYAVGFVQPRVIVFASQFADVVECAIRSSQRPALLRIGSESELGESFAECWTKPPSSPPARSTSTMTRTGSSRRAPPGIPRRWP